MNIYSGRGVLSELWNSLSRLSTSTLSSSDVTDGKLS